ncbi:hypothetical protein BAUCODRAFT_346869 [Baudoinia panamericana UAMH 10762]|uniref:Zn(2)-C6 fungal-type domain-containing protein n=1 Tax=Baudoinia panamericana (strain UAMH 10762) TaxID=717646 RepID=M2NKL4_BAUPA|nr:uncharacterized protein BAUCODRAFT_346869 [Baudoinia panamericana UAMH 10762]EMC99675.1 hypothetical protein BAUCODRAFT_346869 [Baudoinia panamericana UAMH 10762]
MADSSNAQGGPIRYPSPQQQQGLPFYQQNTPSTPYQNAPDVQQEPGPQGMSEPLRGTSIGDDAQLRGLANMVGVYNEYGGPISHAHPGQETPQPPPSYPPTTDQPVAVSLSIPPKQRERTKVSRACDECRRKKIRCDAVDETGITACSNCARTGAICAFSRQPMKRGPSKGYIKELAERLDSLESQVHSPGGAAVSPQARYEIQQMQQVIAAEGYGRDVRSLQDAPHPRVGEKRSIDAVEAALLASRVERQPSGQRQLAIRGRDWTGDCCLRLG